MPNDDASGDARVGRDGLVSRIAGDNSRPWVADHAGQHQYRRPIAVLFGKLRQARSIAIDHGARRYPVKEPGVAKALEGKRGGERWRSRSNHFGHGRSSAIGLFHDFHQVAVAVVRCGHPFALVRLPKVAVIVMETPKLKTALADRAR